MYVSNFLLIQNKIVIRKKCLQILLKITLVFAKVDIPSLWSFLLNAEPLILSERQRKTMNTAEKRKISVKTPQASNNYFKTTSS